MQVVNMGRSDLKVSQVALGGMSFGPEEWMVDSQLANQIITAAIDGGINYIDTANIYSGGKSEEIIGHVVKEYRDEIVLSTKVGGKFNDIHQGFGRKDLRYQLRESLKRLQTDYVDIYYLHTWFDSLNVDEISSTMDSFVREGKTSYLGLSNVLGYQLAEYDLTSMMEDLERPIIVQNHYNAVYREDEREVIPYCKKYKIAYSPFSPIAAGFLSGKYEKGSVSDTPRTRTYPVMKSRYFKEEDFNVLESMKSVASDMDVKPAQIAIAYTISKGFIPVLGATKVEHVEDAVAAASLTLKAEHIRRIEESYIPHPVIKGTAGY